MILYAPHPAQDSALGTTTNWSTVLFHLEYGTVDEDGLIYRPFEMAFCIPEGYGLVFNIPKRRQRLPLRLNYMNYNGALTWEVQFDYESGPQESIPRLANAIYSSKMRSNAHEQHDIPFTKIDRKALGYKVRLLMATSLLLLRTMLDGTILMAKHTRS
jgi:hypothetical protein